MQVKYAYLDREYTFFKKKIDQNVFNCLKSGSFILRQDVDLFEKKIVNLHGGNGFCIGVNSGTDALEILLKLSNLPKNSYIIVPSHTYISTVNAIIKAELKPLFCDIENDGNVHLSNIESTFNKNKNKNITAVFVTHMNGLIVDMKKISLFCKKNKLHFFEDAAQAIGSYENKNTPGRFSDGAAYSLHPLKTLSVAGDGGFIFTKNKKLAKNAKAYRNLGQYVKGKHEIIGVNSRLDNLHAAIANVKLEKLKFIIKKRQNHAKKYISSLKKISDLNLPLFNYDHSFSNFVVNTSRRDELQKYLTNYNIEVMVHWYPTLNSLKLFQKYSKKNLINTEKYVKSCISLPISPWMTEEERQFVINKILDFYK